MADTDVLNWTHCKRCHNNWLRRSVDRPVRCPKCSSPLWYLPYKRLERLGADQIDRLLGCDRCREDNKGRLKKLRTAT